MYLFHNFYFAQMRKECVEIPLSYLDGLSEYRKDLRKVKGDVVKGQFNQVEIMQAISSMVGYLDALDFHIEMNKKYGS